MPVTEAELFELDAELEANLDGYLADWREAALETIEEPVAKAGRGDKQSEYQRTARLRMLLEHFTDLFKQVLHAKVNPVINVQAPVVNVAPAEVLVEPRVDIPAPIVNVAPAVVNVEPATVNFMPPAPQATETTIERNNEGEIVRTVQRPV